LFLNKQSVASAMNIDDFSIVPCLAQGDSTKLLIGIGVVFLTLAVLGVLLVLARRMYLKNMQASPETDFTIDALENMRRDGRISDEEFEVLRRKALGLGSLGNVEKQTGPHGDSPADQGSQAPGQGPLKRPEALRPPPEDDDGNTDNPPADRPEGSQGV
jgi:hypothetical protein